MPKAHDDARATISLALVAALVVRPLEPSLSRDELERVVTTSGVSNQVYKEVIQEELAKRDQERARRVTISGFDLMRFQVTEGFPPQVPIDTAYDLGEVFERLNYEGVRVPKTLDALRAACDAPADQVDRALAFMLVFGIAKKVDGGFVCEGMQGDYGKVAVNHPEEAKLARMVEVVRAITTTEPVRTESKATTVDSKADSADAQAVTSGDATKVFIIHGRNTAARNAVEQFVRSLGLEPLDFDQVSADMGGSPFIGEVVRKGLELAHGIIAVFTPDEFSGLDPLFRGAGDQSTDTTRWQSRPNVLFEAGMAFGMSRGRTVLVTLGNDVSLFSDVAGVHVVRLDNNVENRKKLRQRLIGMQCAVDTRADGWTDPGRAGDFEACVKRGSATIPRDPFAGTASQPVPRAPRRGPSMSQQAEDLMRALAKLYVEHGYPNHKVWTFDKGADSPVHDELMNGLGFIKLMGTRGAAYTLTDRGHAWVMDHKDDAVE